MLFLADKSKLTKSSAENNLMCDKGKLIRIEDATHWQHHEKAEEVNQLILNFL